MIQVRVNFDVKAFSSKETFDKAQKQVTRQIVVAAMANAYRKYEKDDAFCANTLLLEDCLNNGILGPEEEAELIVLNRSMNIDNIIAV